MPKKEKRTKLLQVRISKIEAENLKKKADNEGYCISEYVRFLIKTRGRTR